jgi:hypothetical protein
MRNAIDGSSRFHAFPNPMFSLMQMAAKNNAASKYLAIEENFLLAAMHVAAMKDIPFARGTLPDFPADMPSIPSKYVLPLLPQCYEIPIQLVVLQRMDLTNALKSSTIHSLKNVEQKGALPQLQV